MRHGMHSHRGMRGFGGLRTFVLFLLDQKPARGADIISELSGRTMGWWRPSPGSIYPLLSSMESEGMIRKLPDGRYEITKTGKEELEYRLTSFRGIMPFGEAGSLKAIIGELRGYVAYFQDEPEKVKEYANDIREIINELETILKNMK